MTDRAICKACERSVDASNVRGESCIWCRAVGPAADGDAVTSESDATKTSPAVGDVVPVGTLPAGAVVEWVSGGVDSRRVVVTGDRPNGRRGRYLEQNGVTCGWCLDTSLARVVSLPDAPAAPVPESDAVRHWHLRATEALAECERLRADGAALTEIRRHLGIAADEATVDGVKRLFRGERSQAFASFEAQAAAERAEVVQLRADVARLTSDRDEWKAIAETTAQQVREWQAEAARSDEALDRARVERESLDAHLTRTQAELRQALDGREAERARAEAMTEARDAARANYCGALADIAEMCRAMGDDDSDRPVARAQRWAAEAHRSWVQPDDVSEGDRILAWQDAADGMQICARCWYPCDPGTPAGGVCPQCCEDDERAE